MDIELPGTFALHLVGERWWIEAPSTGDPVRRDPIRIPAGAAQCASKRVGCGSLGGLSLSRCHEVTIFFFVTT
jgi:hypothetical protein